MKLTLLFAIFTLLYETNGQNSTATFLACPQIACKRCPTCLKNETLVVSRCKNCCLDRCVRK